MKRETTRMLLDHIEGSFQLENQAVFCGNEYERLRRVLMCPPQYMRITDVINDVQKHYFKNNINAEKASEQFDELVAFLRKQQIQIDLLSPDACLPEQVFTRDIGIVIQQYFIRTNMCCSIRHGEERRLEEWLDQEQIPYIKMEDDHVEAGDIIQDATDIWIGVGHRTSPKIVDNLKGKFPLHHIHPIYIPHPYLHLDCIFNVIAPDVALVFPHAIENNNLQMMNTKYHLIEVTVEEQFHMATNVLSIGNREILSLPQNQCVNKKMREAGLQVHEVDISEIIKSGGSFRCMTLPLYRKD